VNPLFVTENWLIGRSIHHREEVIPMSEIILFDSEDNFETTSRMVGFINEEDRSPAYNVREISNRLNVHTKDATYTFRNIGINE